MTEQHLRLAPWVTVLLLTVSAAMADTLEVGSEKHEGTFQKYEKGRFVFRAGGKKSLNELRSKVRELTLDAPLEASLLRSTRRKPEKFTLIGYKQGSFIVKDDKGEQKIQGMQVATIEITESRSMGAGVGRLGGFGGFNAGDAPEVIPAVDVAALEARPGLTAAQTSVLADYKATRTRYDAFINESSAMVAEMQKSSGGKRAKLLSVLAERKVDEQPLAREMEARTAALRAAFPDAPAPGDTIIPGKKEPDVVTFTENTQAVIKLPKLKGNQILLIETGAFEQIADTPKQKAAVEQYNAARQKYEALAANPPDTEEGVAAGEGIKADVRKAEAALFKAFPQVKVLRE